jgi:hypothetical protein
MAERSAPTTRCKRLPPELIDMIIGHASEWELPTCALVCRSWLPASRHHLFSKAFIFQSSFNSIDTDHSEILSSPFCTVSSVIRHLQLEIEGIKDLHIIARNLPKVTQLSLWESVVDPWVVSSNVMGPLFRNMESLELWQIAFKTPEMLLSILQQSPQLHTISCCYVTFKSPLVRREQLVHQDTLTPKLTSLLMVGSNEVFSWMVARWASAMPQLKILDLNLWPLCEVTSARTLLESVGQSLQVFQVSAPIDNLREWSYS